MPKIHRGSHAPYEAVVGIVGHGLGRLHYAYRDQCYGGQELQFRVRTAKHRYSPLGDGSANSELRKLGITGPKRPACPTCWTEVSRNGKCECSDGNNFAHTTKFGDGRVYTKAV
ncbi:hypothetical protein ZANY_41 [Gordonia phage Zany]|uniref:Uncharacterized protein n=2 Tax=Lambovirus TaxID=2843412 RepID=A0AA49GYP3_9CAUD|nr:hypothetical protein ZANY_41 [Gordonia phage Zany]